MSSSDHENSHKPANVSETAKAAAAVEATLLASDAPLAPAKIAEVAGLPGAGAVKQAVETLNARYTQSGSSFRIEAIAGGYQIFTLPEYHEVLSRLSRTRRETHLTRPALETLAIVAYRQPILRADIEAIRGVACGEVLRGLIEKQLVKIVARAEVLGRPMLYGTTKKFLELFGLAGLDDLPRAEELRAAFTETPAAASDSATRAEAETSSEQSNEGTRPQEQEKQESPG
ncbi:MAG: SMC-Scp complex subunit ScpB [Planctomycetota bacterium]|jgi:segregation and condensation protein B